MFSTFLQILPLSLGGAVNPLGILIIFFLLAGKDRPLKRTWLFLLGSAVFLILVVLIEHTLLKYTLGVSRHQTTYSAGLDIILGVILILLAIFRKKKQKIRSEKTRNLWGGLIYGFLFMAIDFSTLVLYFAAVKLVFDANLSFWQNTIIFTINIIIIMSTMALPVFLATVMPVKSAVVLDWLKRFISKYGSLVSKIVIVLIAIYLISKGVNFFY